MTERSEARGRVVAQLMRALDEHGHEGWYRDVREVEGPGLVVATARATSGHRRAYFRLIEADASHPSPPWQLQVAVELQLSGRFSPAQIPALLAWTRTNLGVPSSRPRAN